MRTFKLNDDEQLLVIEGLRAKAREARSAARALTPMEGGQFEADSAWKWAHDELMKKAAACEVLAEKVGLPLSLNACPKCATVPLADDGEHRLLCETCNEWYDIRTGKPCEPPGHDAALA